MTNKDKFSVYETSGGTYSARKIPHWRMKHNDLLEYLEFVTTQFEDPLVTSVAG